MSWLLDKEIVRELPETWKGIVPTEVFFQEAQRILEKAEAELVPLRILGGLGAALHCREFRDFAIRLGRTGTGAAAGQEYTDIDFVSYRRYRDKVKELFGSAGYAKRKATLSSAASERQIYYHPKGWFYVDVFFDRLLVANHPLDFRGRLELDYPTVSISDILLEKLQMWEAFSAKDLKDCLLILKSHPIDMKTEKEGIDAEYISKLLSEDWGFWYTATTNLKKIAKFIHEIDRLGKEIGIAPNNLQKDELDEIEARINKLLDIIDGKPKPFKWKMRAKIGTKQRWYNPVERPETVSGFGIWEAILRQ